MTNLFEPYSESFLPLLQKFYSLESIAKEPWTDDSVLYLPHKSQILIENGGAESFATAIFLSMLNLNYKIKFVKNVNEMSPSGKSPLLKCGKYSIGEFEPVVNFCYLKGYKLLSSYLDNSKKAQIKSFILLIQKTYSDTMNYFLWKNSTNLNLIKQSFRENYPWPLSDLLYLREYYFVKNKLTSNKLWDLHNRQILDRFNEVNDSLNRKLEGNLYLFGNSLTEVDILLFSYLKALNLFPTFDSMVSCLHDYRNIVDFYSRLSTNFEKILNEKFNL